MLSFQFPSYKYTILDSSRRPTSLSLAAQLHGMFFLAESSRAGSGDSLVPPVELTCYRRNLFQITGCITLPQMMRHVVTDQGETIPIIAQELAISATESVEGHPIKIISVPWKTPAAGTTSTPEDKTEKEPSSISLHKMSDQYIDGDYAKFPIEWKRLQFRVATANNGRRKELQQHFTIKLSVLVTLSTGEKVSVCEALSGPIIVRGRSPRNFQQRRDFPLSGTGGSMRKAMQSSSSRHRTSSPEDLLRRSTSRSRVSPTISTNVSTRPSPHLTQSPHLVHSPHLGRSPQMAQSAQFFDWNTSSAVPTSAILTPTATRISKAANVLDYTQPSPEFSEAHKPMLKRKAATPDPSSIAFRNYDDLNYGTSERPRKTARMRTSTVPSSPDSLYLPFTPSPEYPINNLPTTISVTSADMVNKYLPVGLEDWMPPVENMYKHQGFQQMFQPSLLTVGDMNRGRGHKRFMSDSFI